jgi:hypothetical protein
LSSIFEALSASSFCDASRRVHVFSSPKPRKEKLGKETKFITENASLTNNRKRSASAKRFSKKQAENDDEEDDDIIPDLQPLSLLPSTKKEVQEISTQTIYQQNTEVNDDDEGPPPLDDEVEVKKTKRRHHHYSSTATKRKGRRRPQIY